MLKGIGDFLSLANVMQDCDSKAFGSINGQVRQHISKVGCPTNLTILDTYPTECETLCAVAESKVVFGVYKDWAKSSNMQVLASGIGRPIVVNHEYYMADVVRTFGGGVCGKGGDVLSTEAGIRSILDTPQNGYRSNYAEAHSYVRSSTMIESLLK